MARQRWMVTIPGTPGMDPRHVEVEGELVLKESGALAIHVSGVGWTRVFSPRGWLDVKRVDNIG